MGERDPRIAADAALMARVAAGDERACRLLIDQNAGRARATARRLLGADAEADDMVQDAFIRAWRVAADWRAEAPFGAWLGRVTANLCLDRLRKTRPQALDDVANEDHPVEGGEEEAAERDLRARVTAAVARLPDRQRVALTLCAYEGHTAAEAAGLMGSSEGGVESLLVRARRQLKIELEDVADAAFGGVR